jgi:hypothetical protein
MSAPQIAAPLVIFAGAPAAKRSTFWTVCMERGAAGASYSLVIAKDSH